MIKLQQTSFMPQNSRGLYTVIGELFSTTFMVSRFSVMMLPLDPQTGLLSTERVHFA